MPLHTVLLAAAAAHVVADVCAPYTIVNGTGLMDTHTVLGHYWNVSAPADWLLLTHCLSLSLLLVADEEDSESAWVPRRRLEGNTDASKFVNS